MSNVHFSFSLSQIAALETALSFTLDRHPGIGHNREEFVALLADVQNAALASADADDRDSENAEADLMPGEDMDGDFDSAMASAGFGTDEDYGYFGED